MAAGSEPAVVDWYQMVVPSIGITLVAILGFIGSYFKKAAEHEPAASGNVVAKAVGAAFVDDTTAAAVLRIDANVAALAKASKDRADRDRDEEIAERAAERAAEEIERRLAKRKE